MHVCRSTRARRLVLVTGLCMSAMCPPSATRAETEADTTVSFAIPTRSVVVHTERDSIPKAAPLPVVVAPPRLGAPPPTLGEIGPWIDYKVRYQVPALPDEA